MAAAFCQLVVEHILQFQHRNRGADRQDQAFIDGAAGGFDQIAHDREQALDALGGEL